MSNSTKTIDIELRKKDFNEFYLPYLNLPDRFIIFYGGAGSGKSVFIAQRCLYQCLKEKYYRLLFARKINRTIRFSQFQLFKDLIIKSNLSQLFIIKEANMEIQCLNGNMLIAVGMDDREKIKSIQEPTDVWMEEATEFSKEDLMQFNLRLRTAKKSFNQIILSFNPITNQHWIYDSFFVNNEFESLKIKSNYLNNKFLDINYFKELEQLKNIDENYYKIYALGDWGGTVKGVIYSKYELCEKIPDDFEIIYGLDFGFNNATALVQLGIKDNILYINQLLYKSKLTNADLINELKQFNIGSKPIYADAAEPQRIEEIYRAGYNIKPAHKEKDSVKKGIDSIKSMQLFITDSSSDTIKEIQIYKWAEDKNGKALDEPVKFNDHAMDAMRYAIHTHLNAPTGKYNLIFT